MLRRNDFRTGSMIIKVDIHPAQGRPVFLRRMTDSHTAWVSDHRYLNEMPTTGRSYSAPMVHDVPVYPPPAGALKVAFMSHACRREQGHGGTMAISWFYRDPDGTERPLPFSIHGSDDGPRTVLVHESPEEQGEIGLHLVEVDYE